MALANFEEQLMREYRELALQLSEARSLIKLLDPRFQKIAELIKTYGLEERLDKPEPGDDPNRPGLTSTNKGELIKQAATDLLMTNNNNWMKLSDLYSHLIAIGVGIGGKNPSSTLSAHLSNSKMFEGDRAKGWRLKPKVFKSELTTENEKDSDQSANSGPIESGSLPPNPGEEKGR